MSDEARSSAAAQATKGAGKKLLAVALGLAVGLALCEAVVSVAGIAPEVRHVARDRYRLSPNPLIGFETVPLYAYDGDDPFEFRDPTNSLGFRDREHAVAKAPGMTRLMVLGDSVSMGLTTARSRDVYPAVLERRLRALGKRVEVLNFGVSGYNTQQEVATLRDKGLRFAPDLVLVQYSLNDTERFDGGILEDLQRLEKEAAGGADWSLMTPLLLRSAAYRFVYFNLFPGRIEERRTARDEKLQALSQDMVDPSFALLRRTAGAHGFEVLVAVFPLYDKSGMVSTVKRLEEYPRVARLAAANRFHHLDLRAALDRCAAATGEKVGVDCCHPSVLGHRCAAEAIAEYLVDRGLVR